ncbi:SMEK domain-containing protein [Microscilla marina]|uniref:SMEK domain-containing protein n=1 Tax=Microscilla marina ATCC 23134 TaxID=313606 RepID=A1ZY03_MICM2|nr:SMEK domain-containing protein [Microscilla marina]EAY24740.1 conserved hypothetical protein [Microscilla marina ATCC 23134]
MSHNRDYYLKQISHQLAVYRVNIHQNSKGLNDYSYNTGAEYFYRDLLNTIYDWKLTNLNSQTKNAAAIDLGDKNAKVAIQITSDSSSNKVHETLKKFMEGQLYQDYERLIVLVITTKQNFPKADFEKNYNPNLFIFDKKTDIWGIEDLLKDINDCSIDALSKIHKLVIDELAPKRLLQPKQKKSKEEVTIIRLIEYLSSDGNYIEIEEEFIIDPKHKIYKRFSDHKEFIISEYSILYPTYFGALDNAKQTTGLDGIKAVKITNHLNIRSNQLLNKNDNNPKQALEEFNEILWNKIDSSEQYDREAIRFYLLNELVQCNIFPNSKQT